MLGNSGHYQSLSKDIFLPNIQNFPYLKLTKWASYIDKFLIFPKAHEVLEQNQYRLVHVIEI